jgi:hypothetical protein
MSDTNSSSIEISNDNSSSILSENETADVIQPDAVFDNNYSEQISEESDNTTEEFHSGPHYEANWTFIDKETVRVIFSLFSLSKLSDEKQFSDQNNNKKKLYATMVSLPSHSILSIYSLKYYLFTIRQYKTNTDKILKMEQLILKTTSTRKDEHFSNSLLLIRLNPKEKYSVCIYYYQMNISNQMPDLIICQDVMHDHLKHSVHGLLFVLTQYSIILGILIVLQGLFSIRKRRATHIIHQHLMNKTQRIRSTLSSVSLVPQSFSSIDATHNTTNDQINPEENKLKKRITSSPAIVLSEPPPNNTPKHADENEPFLKLTSNKNHVHFFCNLDEGSDDNESNDVQNDSTLNPHNEPYGDRSDALSSMAHILDINKPWSKHNQHNIPV